jgi:hypothetical protein
VGGRARDVEQFDGFFASFIAAPQGVMPKHARGSAVDLACEYLPLS